MPETTTDIRFDVDEEARWRRRLHVTVPADRVRERRRKIVHRVASRMKLPGFRKGRVPSDLVEKRYGDAIRRELLDSLIQETYREALGRSNLQPISDGRLESVDYEPEKDLTFAISFDVQPEIQLSRLGGFRVERPRLEVGDEQVERVIRRLREENGVWNPAEGGRPEPGDLVAVEIAPVDAEGERGEARPYEFVLGEGDAIPDVEAVIGGLAPGESGEFTVRFPDDFPDEERRAAERRLHIALHDRKVRRLPELDDEFARSLGDFEGVEDLRAKIREDLAKEAAREGEAHARRRLVDLLLEANPFEVPDSMVDRYVGRIVGDPEDIPEEKLQELRAQIRPDAERSVKRALLIDRIAETQGLRATDEEVEARIEEIAEKNERTASEVRAQLRRSDRLDALRHDLTEEKVFAFLESKSEVVERKP